ncbi:hypothetical protein D9V84_08400 [Bacteroidetes/Chlorobi group bacterium Naka2016]|jgi:hypothetical protein|nr:MAG: hypothetical protein D9V84_08400 [Bacteroidetes/Chlorobi group bacterium Naka2016]
MLKTIAKIIFFVTILIVSLQILFAQPNYIKMQISPLNRTTIFFDELPTDFNSYLSQDKTILSIVVNNANSKVRSDSVVSDGIIKKVELKKFSNHLEFNLYLKSPRGFTITPLEFSRALLIEVFDWNSLTPAEDNYRMGQLSINNNLAVARNYFKKSFDESIANAGYFLGYLYLKANMPQLALETLEKAEKLGCNIPDIYAALAQTYYLFNDKKNYEKYKNQFYAVQKDVSFKFIEIIPELKDSILKEYSNIFEITEEKVPDTTSPKVDAAKKVTPIVIKETPTENKTERFSIVEKVLIFLVASILVTTILLISLYLKWKKEKRLLEIKQKFETELVRQRRKSISNKIAAETYKKAEEATKTEKATEKYSEQTLNPEIKNLAEQIIDSKRAEVNKEKNDLEKITTKSAKIPPRIEVAMQIQKEQAELIKRKIDKLEVAEIPLEKEKLEELAKNLGINKTSLLAKKNIEAIESNKELHKKLFEKFFPKRDE